MEHIDDLRLEETMAETYPGRHSAMEIIEDLRHTLNPDDILVNGSELPQLWIGYAEQSIEPAGWQALWRSDRNTSTQLKEKLLSPSLVEVVHVDYETLEATVEQIKDPDEEMRSVDGEQFGVRLTELHPLVKQENGAVNVEATHLALQKMRFFDNHLSFPWDSEVNENWFDVHLPVRVKMFCEMRTGSLNPEMAVRYRFLVKEAREAERKLQKMAEKVQDSDDEMEEETMLKIAELNTKLEQVQQDVEILLNPATRMLLFGSKVTRVKENEQPEVLLVVQGQSCHELHQILNRVERQFTPQLNVKCYPSLQAAVDDARTNDVVLIPTGIHSLLNINALRQGGTLRGIGSREDVVVHLGSNSEVGLFFETGHVTLKNLTILVNNKQSGVSSKGRLELEECAIRGPPGLDAADGEGGGGESAWKGFYVAPHSLVALRDCVVSHFDVGLRVRAGGRALLRATQIEACNIGILAEQHASIEIVDCDVKNCKENAIVVEMDAGASQDQQTVCGGVDLLKTVPETFQTEDCRCYGNAFNIKLEYC